MFFKSTGVLGVNGFFENDLIQAFIFLGVSGEFFEVLFKGVVGRF